MLVHSRGLHLGVFVGSWELAVHLCIPCLEGGGGLGPVSEGADCELLVQLWDLCLGGGGGTWVWGLCLGGVQFLGGGGGVGAACGQLGCAFGVVGACFCWQFGACL